MNIKEAKKVLKDYGYIGIDCLFHKDDIISTSNDTAMPLNDIQVKEVIEEIGRTFDGEYGITWQTINDFVESKYMEQFKYRALSPDGIYLEHDVYGYKTKEEANEAIDKFVKNYEFQGYYSDKYRNRIPINEIKEYCKIIEL